MKGINAHLTDFITNQSARLHQQVAGIRDGDPDSIHDARVATRRIRAALAVIGGNGHPAWRAVDQQMRALARALGAARDLDVIADLIEHAHTDASGDHPMAAFRRCIQKERADARRKLIKAVERIPLHALVPTERKHVAGWWLADSNAAAALTAQMRQQSAALLDSVAHASGVYFPKRTHEVRVHAKRLRYLVEVATHAGRWSSDREARLLARVQSVLGDLHDREVLIQRLATAEPVGNDVISAVRDGLVHERDQLFEKYLALRKALEDVSATIQSVTGVRRRNWSLMAATVALPSAFVVGLIAAERRRASARPRREHRAIVPDVHRLQRPAFCGDVGLEPRDPLRGLAESGLSAPERGTGHVEHSETVESSSDQ